VAHEPSYDAWIDRLRLEPVLFDTMIVRHLCAVGGGDYLAEAFAGRLVWPEAVNAEPRLQSNSIHPLRNFLSSRPATVLEVDAADEPEVEDIRIDMYTKRAARLSDTEHLGEAQCRVGDQGDVATIGPGPGCRVREVGRGAVPAGFSRAVAAGSISTTWPPTSRRVPRPRWASRRPLPGQGREIPETPDPRTSAIRPLLPGC